MANRTRSHTASGRHRTSHHAPPADAEPSLLDAIAAGELDDHLGALAAAVDARMHLLHTLESSHFVATLCVGDRVRINDKVRPRYLAGLDATVIEIETHAVTIRLDQPIGRFESGRLRCAPLAFDKL